MSHALFPAATFALATSDVLAVSKAHIRRSVEGAAALRASTARLSATLDRRGRAFDRLARARAARAAAEAL